MILANSFPFFVIFLFGFGTRVMMASQNEFASFFFSAFLGTISEKNRCYLFSKCLIELACEAIRSWAFFLLLGVVKISFSFSAKHS